MNDTPRHSVNVSAKGLVSETLPSTLQCIEIRIRGWVAMVAHIFKPSMWEAEVGEFQVSQGYLVRPHL